MKSLNEKSTSQNNSQMKPWQKGIDLNTLLAHTKRFENYNKFSCSPFSEMKKNDIAEHLSNGTVVNLKGSTFTIQECKTRSPIYMYQDIPIGYREPGDVKIDRFSFTDYSHESQQEFYDYVIRNHRTDVWVCSWAEDTATNDIFDTQLGFQKVGTKVTTFGELIVYWFLPYSKDIFGGSREHPKVPDTEYHNLVKLKLPTDISHLISSIREKLSKLPAFSNHYSNYNKRKSWSAVSLRGYRPEPEFMTKPSEMNSKWQEENKDVEFKMQDTYLYDDFAEVRELVQMLKADEVHRIRFMKLKSGDGELDRHTDLVDTDSGVGDGKLMRIHFPIITNDKVLFESWDLTGHKQTANMKVNEAWLLDTRKPHRAVNEGKEDRVHLVIDIVSNEQARTLL